MDKGIDKAVLKLIQASLWDKEPPVITQDLYEEMRNHVITPLPGRLLSSVHIEEKLLNNWKMDLCQHYLFYYAYEKEQSTIGITAPYVILKGTTAAQYYPHPDLRTMGDIDIMTKHEDINAACIDMERNGYRKTKESNREIVYDKNGFVIEIHKRFASLNEPVHAKFLDDLIIQNINPSHVLPDLVNGLVLLEHISQHLENGLGLRQIIDWMMFVEKCLPDEKWREFSLLVREIGLEKLAIVTTKMCEIYLGLPQRKWCAEADEKLCRQLMDYVLSSGNFGNKMTTDADISQNVFAHARTPKSAFRLLQQQGMTNWAAARDHKMLKPFAWIYQAIRYFYRGIRREKAASKLRNEYKTAKRRNEMLKSLGVKMKAKGIAILKDGEYVKE